MKLFRRSKNRAPADASPSQRRSSRDGAEGSNSTRRRPDPAAEPIPDGEHKYVPRSPYRTGNY